VSDDDIQTLASDVLCNQAAQLRECLDRAKARLKTVDETARIN